MNERLSYDEWLSDTDGLLWHMERDPLLRSTIVSVWILDRAPTAKQALRTFERSIAAVPRFRQRVVADPAGLARPRWELDPLFDLDYHLRRYAAPGKAGLREVLDIAGPIASQAFDRDRPLWECHLIEGLREERAAMILKSHHAMSDGIGGLRMIEPLLDRQRRPRKKSEAEASAGAPSPAGHRSGTLEQLGSAVLRRALDETDLGVRTALAVGRGWRDFALDPLGSARRFQETAGSIARTLRPVSEPLSPLMRNRSMNFHLETLSLPLEPLKCAGRRLGGTLNDAFVTAVTGGLRLYHEHKGVAVDELRMTMPINLRQGDKGQRAGNQFAAMRLQVPVGIEDPRQRFERVHELLTEQKGERSLGWMDEITQSIARLGILPATQIAGAMFKAVDFITSNVPGLPKSVYVAGAKVEALYPFGPPTGAAVNVTLLSYDGRIQIGVNCDRASITEPELLAECLGESFAEVARI